MKDVTAAESFERFGSSFLSWLVGEEEAALECKGGDGEEMPFMQFSALSKIFSVDL